MKKPFAFIYMIEMARATNMSTHGYCRETSPNITRIGDEGAIFCSN